MALFPAYQIKQSDKECDEKSDNFSWLQNESCPKEIIVANQPSQFEQKEKGNEDQSISSSIQDKEYLRHISKKIHKHSSKKKKHKSKDKHRSRKYSSDNSKYQNESRVCPFAIKNQNKNVFLSGPIIAIRSEDVIYIDYDGDRNNTIFEMTHYSQLASYLKKKSYLGNNLHVFNKKRKLFRYFDKKIRLKLIKPTQTILKPKPNIETKQYLFISCSPDVNKMENLASDSLGILDSATDSYIKGKGIKLIEDESNNEGFELSFWQIRIKEFNENLNKDPSNISLWLEYVHFQDKMVYFWCDNVSKRNTNLTQVTEKKISILDSAIKKNENCAILHLERLNLGQEIWNQETLVKEWDNLINKFPDDFKVWQQFLIFHQTNFSTYNLNLVIEAQMKYSKRLIGRTMVHSGSLTEDLANTHLLVNNVLQLAYHWKQVGHIERAIALFQALIEINLYCPSQLRQSNITKQDILDIFEVFWDSKAPRFGEKDSGGWAQYLEKRENVIFPEEILEGTRDDEDDILSKGGEKSSLWVAMESSRELNHWLPWQSDPDNCEDPERIISYSEIRNHLFLIYKEEEQFYLVLQFLSFLGLTIPEYIRNINKCDNRKYSMFALRIENLKELLIEVEDRVDISGGVRFGLPDIGLSVRNLKCEQYFDFVCRIIQNCIYLFSNQRYRIQLVVILIRLYHEKCSIIMKENSTSLSTSVKVYKKQIKNFLKQPEFRNSLEIYYEFALFEKNVENFDEAIKIHSMSLTLGLQITEPFLNNENSVFLLYHLFSIIKINIDRIYRENSNLSLNFCNSIQNLICSFVLEKKFSMELNPPNASTILRTKKQLSHLQDSSFNKINTQMESNPIVINSIVTLLAILQLLTMGYKPACLIFEDGLDKINNKMKDIQTDLSARVKELIYENYVWFIHSAAPKLSRIISNLQMSPSSARNIVEEAVKVAPYNLNILSSLSHFQCQAWRHMISSIRKFEYEEKDPSILVVIFQIIPQLQRAFQDADDDLGIGVLSYQLLNILEVAVTSGVGRHCPLLWRIYLRITHRTNRKAFHKIAYRAINNCPFAKCIYLDCIQLSPELLPELMGVMCEKGIRIRLPLEELEILLEAENEEMDGDEMMDALYEPKEKSDELDHPSEESDELDQSIEKSD